jgi:cytochrome c-type biogenesis protein CcmH/NrfF
MTRRQQHPQRLCASLLVAWLVWSASPIQADGTVEASAIGTEQAQGADGLVSDPDAEARRVQGLTRSVMSPFCPGKTVAACPSPNAQAWRDDIRNWVAQGVSNEEIRQRLEARVPGFDLSGRPGGAWGWGLPLFGMALASLWLGFMWRRARSRRATGEAEPTATSRPGGDEAPSEAPSDALDTKLREELESFET